MHKYPTIAETTVPIIMFVQLNPESSDILISKNGYRIDVPKMIGTVSKNENFVAVSLSNPENKPDAIVKPERENPGKTAKPWAKPIIIAFLRFILSVFASKFLETYSLKNRIMPVPISNTETIFGE